MKKILIGWEMGSGHGHISILLPLARALAEAGHRPILALSVLTGNTTWLTDPMIRSGRIQYVQGPSWNWGRTPAAPVFTLADPLFNMSWDQPDYIEVILRAWRGLLDLARPDAVIAELSPTLSLATWGRLPTLVIGSGYNVPPPLTPLAPIRFYDPAVPPESRERERQINAAIGVAMGRVGVDEAPALGDLFKRDGAFVCCSPQLDPYRGYRQGQPYLGPLETITAEGAETAPGRRGRAFAYLDAKIPHWNTVIAALNALGVPVDVYARNAKAQAAPGSRVTIHLKPLQMERVLAAYDLVIHHGGHTTSEACLRAGVPQLLLPKHLEQTVTSRALIALGTANGHSVSAKDTPESLARIIRYTLNNEDYFRTARAVAAEMSQGDRQKSALAAIVEAVGALP